VELWYIGTGGQIDAEFGFMFRLVIVLSYSLSNLAGGDPHDRV
jgi:hypothetical protein